MSEIILEEHKSASIEHMTEKKPSFGNPAKPSFKHYFYRLLFSPVEYCYIF